MAYRVEASLCTIWRRSALERLSAILGDLAEVDAETPTGTRRRLGQGLEKPLAIWLGTESSNPAPSRGGSADPSVPPGLRDCRRGLIHRAARPAYLVSPDCRCSGALRCAVVAGFIRSFPIRQRPFGPYLSCPGCGSMAPANDPIAGMMSAQSPPNHISRPTTSLSTLRSGRYRTPRKTWYAAAR